MSQIKLRRDVSQNKKSILNIIDRMELILENVKIAIEKSDEAARLSTTAEIMASNSVLDARKAQDFAQLASKPMNDIDYDIKLNGDKINVNNINIALNTKKIKDYKNIESNNSVAISGNLSKLIQMEQELKSKINEINLNSTKILTLDSQNNGNSTNIINILSDISSMKNQSLRILDNSNKLKIIDNKLSSIINKIPTLEHFILENNKNIKLNTKSILNNTIIINNI